MTDLTFDPKTLEVLKNFSTINPELMFNPGNQIVTISPSKKILAYAQIEQTIGAKFAIHELPRLFSALSLFKEPKIAIEENWLTISDADGHSLNYTVAKPEEITLPPKNKIKMPDVNVSFKLTKDNLQNLLKAAAVLSMPEILVTGDGETVKIETTNTAKPSSDVYQIEIDEFVGGTKAFQTVFRVENLKVLPRTYDVSIATGSLAKFESEGLEYYIAVEAKKKK